MHVGEGVHLVLEQRLALADDVADQIDAALLGDVGEVLVAAEVVDADLPVGTAPLADQLLGDVSALAVGQHDVVPGLGHWAEVFGPGCRMAL